MISPAVIRKHGLDARSLKKYFTAKVPDTNVARLNQLVADRINDGRLRNLQNWRAPGAVDFAWDTPFAQTTPTIVRGLMDSCNSTEDVLKALRGWGIDESTLFVTREENGKRIHEFNQQQFTEVFVPLVRSYVTIRLSKIFNDRNLTPLFEYPPREFNAENRLLCKIITEVVETIAIDFGYSSTLRDFIFNALMYSVAIKFPVEPWIKYSQEDDEGEEIVEKQGVRYIVPNVTRTYYDLTYPLATLNTGTGCAFAGYWTVLKWGDVAMDTTMWNRNVVPHGTNWLDPNAQWYNYFKEVYPCVLEFPTPRTNRGNDRENMAFKYTRTDFDSAFFLTYHFQELVPSDWGLGDYNHKVWMRFTIGGDSTVMFAEVMPYHPCEYIGYDADSGRGRNASLALEIIPFQDIVGNVFSQFIQTIKRNLANIIFYDTDTVDSTQLETLKVKTPQQYNGLNFVGVSGISMARSGSPDIGAAFKQVNFQFQDTNQILSGVNTTISLLERVLGMSAQETGSSASHQQSKKEVEITQGSSSNRLAYTASFVDEGIDAWKRHLLDAIMAYMDGKDVIVSIPHGEFENLEDSLKAIGFEFADGPPAFGHAKVSVKGSISRAHLRTVQLVAKRSDAVRQNDAQVATLMMQTLQAIANSQFMSAVVDPQSLVEMMEQAVRMAGGDDDFKVKLNTNALMANELKTMIGQIQQALMAAVEKEVVAPIAQQIGDMQKSEQQNMQQVAKEISDLQNNFVKIEQLLSGGQAGAPTPQITQPGPTPTPPLAVPAPAQVPPALKTAVPSSLVAGNPKHEAIATKYLRRAGGNKKRARELAAQDGYKM